MGQLKVFSSAGIKVIVWSLIDDVLKCNVERRCPVIELFSFL